MLENNLHEHGLVHDTSGEGENYIPGCDPEHVISLSRKKYARNFF
jgi:hypothetical protein